MRKNWKNNLLIMLMLTLITLPSCNKSSEHAEHADSYTCPMHPAVISDKPGSCPVCGMDLVRKGRPDEEVMIMEDLATLIKSPNEVIVSSIKTIKGEFKSMPITVQAQGIVTYDTRYSYTIPARVSGRLEKIYLKYAFQPVRKGQKIAEIYSPELLTAQRELLFLVENDRENTQLIESAKNKLQLLGASVHQIKELIKRAEPQNTFTVYSPYDGYVIPESQQAVGSTPKASASTATSGDMSDGMGSNSSNPAGSSSVINSTTGLVREGQYVSSGQTLFKIVNASAFRIELDLATAQAGLIKKDDEVELDFGNGEMQKASVDFVQPFFNEGENFIKVRVYSKKISDLHIGHLVKAMIHLKGSESLWVPKEAVLDLGTDHIVFIKVRGVFKPKKITTGVVADGWVEVKQGLASSDELAANAQFLVDSESFIRPAN